ncbi:MAG: substrate-binding domain-containing protein [Myxococcota bacterium]|nr:substrate-binding domain-containing protein [Myxococcota bacterium]
MSTRTLALFMRAIDNQYQSLQKATFYARAHLYGFSVVEYDAGNNAESQGQQIRECLKAPEKTRPKGLFVNPVHEVSLLPAAREAARLGIAWVTLNRSSDYVTDLRREYPRVPFFCVDPDQRQVGRIQGQQFRLLLPRGGDLFYIGGPASTSSARLRLAGVEIELAASSIRMVGGGGDWSVESGFQATKGWLQGNRRYNWAECIVGAQNDSMAMGAHNALLEEATERKRPELMAIRITGCDGLPGYGQRFVHEKVLTSTVVIPPTTGMAVDRIALALDSGQPPATDVSMDVRSFPALETLGTSTAEPAHPMAPSRQRQGRTNAPTRGRTVKPRPRGA